MDIFGEISKLKRQSRRAALATIVDVRGSIPSAAAAKMLVFEDGSILGTGGGRLRRRRCAQGRSGSHAG